MSIPIIVNGWTIFAHPLFLAQVHDLIDEVEQRKAKDPKTYKKKNCSKKLKAILKLISEDIPSDPSSEHFRQGKTLGDAHKHWRRAKFFQQYRLFFRYDLSAKVIILAWVNDDDTKRAYDSKTDAYKVFRGMLDDGDPPDDWDTLLTAAKKAEPELEAIFELID